MNPKKVAISFMIVLIICIVIIISIIFYLILLDKKDGDSLNIGENRDNITEFNENDIDINTDVNNMLSDSNEVDEMLNEDATDWMYGEEVEYDENYIMNEVGIESEQNNIESTSWADNVTQEELDNYKFNVSYENMPEEVLGYINNAFENFEKDLKEFVYKNGYAAANKATYNDYRTINSGGTVIINFVLNDYYASSIGILINLDDYSFEFFENQ